MKLLISGANGFIGTNLRQKFRDSWKILSLGRNKGKNDYTWQSLPKAENDDIDCYIHLAAKVHDTKKVSQLQEYLDVNVGLTQKLFDIFLASSAHTFIYFSSVKAVADNMDGELTENEVPLPITPYGKSKWEAENYLSKPSHKNKLDGKRIIILRPCMVHGPGNKGNLNLLYRLVKKNIVYPFGAYSNKRSFLSIGNLSYAVNAMIQYPNFPSGVYNIADDKPLSSNNVVNIINKSLCKKSNIWNVPPFLVNALAKIGDYAAFPLNSERLKKLTQNYIVSNKKIKQALGIEKFPISSKKGLKITIDSFKK